jgi:phosphatidylserine/phosphatidylglycerophosphate/cardiolipin synthase-like enzyme
MIRVDLGNDLFEIMKSACRMERSARLDVAIPFYDEGSALIRLLMKAVSSGVTLRLLTRPGETITNKSVLTNFEDLGANIVRIPSLHAKVLILSDISNNMVMGWIGSHNFTRASENSSLEMGISLMGNDPITISLTKQALLYLDAWKKAALCKNARKFKSSTNITNGGKLWKKD